MEKPELEKTDNVGEPVKEGDNEAPKEITDDPVQNDDNKSVHSEKKEGEEPQGEEAHEDMPHDEHGEGDAGAFDSQMLNSQLDDSNFKGDGSEIRLCNKSYWDETKYKTFKVRPQAPVLTEKEQKLADIKAKNDAKEALIAKK